MKNSFLYFHIKCLLTEQENIQRESSNVEAGPQHHVGAVPGLDIFSSSISVAKDTLNKYSLQKWLNIPTDHERKDTAKKQIHGLSI